MDLSHGLFLLTGDPTTSVQSTAYAPGAVGKFFQIPEDAYFNTTKSPKVYQLVKITSVTSYVQGCPLYWTSTPGVKEVTTAITNTGLAAGVGVSTAALTLANSFIFMQVRGLSRIFVKSAPTANPTTTGAIQAVTGAAAGSCDAVSAAPTGAQSVFGRFVAASSGNELVNVLLTVDIHP